MKQREHFWERWISADSEGETERRMKARRERRNFQTKIYCGAAINKQMCYSQFCASPGPSQSDRRFILFPDHMWKYEMEDC